MVAVYSVLALTAVGLVSTTSASASCDSGALNTTVGTYTTDLKDIRRDIWISGRQVSERIVRPEASPRAD
ncbi:hypothetical protein PR003_g17079 [Phytophthora rubi]|uniref:RxLR effector protein n=1 Tax=Phytophthora rubi TaxID=129364 RepID=A0A6A4EB78_9STRA|nr:hypothetical protein PR002_g17225 [Phytophthora rubi]KAE9008307.1 hypothetical protein PR001_g16728 [Phytophthora rubi]KAE9323003.1 hypothetical protein PR003_g17079 [Phytophthora rubi]